MTKKKKNSDDERDGEEELGGSESAFDWDGAGAEEAAKILRGIESIIPEIIKKTVVQGVGNILSGTDEGIRSTFEDNKKKPKEAMGFLLNQGDWMRKEILRIVSNEVRVFLENMDFGGEVAKILTTLSFEIKTEIRFAPNEDRVRPEVKNSVKVKRNKKKKNKEKDSEETTEDVQEDGVKKGFSRWRRKGKSDDSEE